MVTSESNLDVFAIGHCASLGNSREGGREKGERDPLVFRILPIAALAAPPPHYPCSNEAEEGMPIRPIKELAEKPPSLLPLADRHAFAATAAFLHSSPAPSETRYSGLLSRQDDDDDNDADDQKCWADDKRQRLAMATVAGPSQKFLSSRSRQWVCLSLFRRISVGEPTGQIHHHIPLLRCWCCCCCRRRHHHHHWRRCCHHEVARSH
mmetsp:Transcript_77846/g.170523  ORF Transcript_77846/g.170523 Transcript_77846/m.170523 type:complete len:208 (+) Transcript_77846:136-759(+)